MSEKIVQLNEEIIKGNKTEPELDFEDDSTEEDSDSN